MSPQRLPRSRLHSQTRRKCQSMIASFMPIATFPLVGSPFKTPSLEAPQQLPTLKSSPGELTNFSENTVARIAVMHSLKLWIRSSINNIWPTRVRNKPQILIRKSSLLTRERMRKRYQFMHQHLFIVPLIANMSTYVVL